MIQAGASERGLTFGARWGEVIFGMQHDEGAMRALRTNVRDRAELVGRDREGILMTPAIQTIIGETEQIAKEKQAYMRELVPMPSALSLLSAHSSMDLGTIPLDTPLEDVIEQIGGAKAKGTAALLQQAYERGMCTLEEAAREFGTSELTPQIVGTPEQVAEQMQALFDREAVDGFVLTPTMLPGTFVEFVNSVVPILQRMGIHRTEYAGTTLRDNLGLPIPQ